MQNSTFGWISWNFTSGRFNFTSSPAPVIPENKTGLTAVLCTIIYITTTFIVMADVVIIRSFLLHHNARVTRNYYIVHLAVCDLLTGIFIIPLYSHTLIVDTWIFGDTTCVVWNIANQTLNLASDISLVLIAHDRYQLCRDALGYWGSVTVKKIKIQLGVSWVIILTIKTIFMPVSNHYYHQYQDETAAPEPSCSPANSATLPYLIGYRAADIITSSLALSIEVFLPLCLLTLYHFAVLRAVYQRRKIRKNATVGTLAQATFPRHVMQKKLPTNAWAGSQLHSSDGAARAAFEHLPETPHLDRVPSGVKTLTQNERSSATSREPSLVLEPFSLATSTPTHSIRHTFGAEQFPHYDRQGGTKPIPNVLTVPAFSRSSSSDKSTRRCLSMSDIEAAAAQPSPVLFLPTKHQPSPPSLQDENTDESESDFSDSDPNETSSQEETQQDTARSQKTQLPKDASKPCKKKARFSIKDPVRRKHESTVSRRTTSGRRKHRYNCCAHKGAIIIGLLLLVFAISKLPFAIVTLLEAMYPGSISLVGLEIVRWLYWANLLLNPLIYAFMSNHYRTGGRLKGFLQVVCFQKSPKANTVHPAK